ncbi:flagellin [Dechloromonas denitrificans]|uniref:flagellin N-terminal helical domain-containing protein n=1 Tax=Azonexaceae TaxID=2008795 RepID=UPI001CF89620|nr:flagellin [Dechloromonas denitrificans]UCV04572.1 flagellin FliC [Dechloromonas denitrificans]UCV08901.1 flagellin FliC [Dechloromonas denitrificans]
MAQQINTNLYSLNAQRNLNKNALGLSSAIERLSSGLRINSAKDDAAGLAVSLNMDAEARGISAKIRNNSDLISQAQVADGALQVVGDILLRMSELESQAGSTTLTSTDKGYINSEFTALSASMATIQTAATLNGQTSFAQGITSVASVSTTVGASAANITAALGSVAASRATAGAVMNNLQFQIQSQEANYENQMAAKTRIVAADFAQETANLARSQILQQAGTAMVAQANQIPQNVLSLLR